jgi:hypothetical protein
VGASEMVNEVVAESEAVRVVAHSGGRRHRRAER